MKFKKGDYVVNKWNSDIIHKVSDPQAYEHNCYPGYMRLEGEIKAVREEDYILINSIEELLRYAAIGLVSVFIGAGFLCAVMILLRFVFNIQF